MTVFAVGYLGLQFDLRHRRVSAHLRARCAAYENSRDDSEIARARFARRPARSCNSLDCSARRMLVYHLTGRTIRPDVEIRTELDNLNVLFDVHVTYDAADRYRRR